MDIKNKRIKMRQGIDITKKNTLLQGAIKIHEKANYNRSAGQKSKGGTRIVEVLAIYVTCFDTMFRFHE